MEMQSECRGTMAVSWILWIIIIYLIIMNIQGMNTFQYNLHSHVEQNYQISFEPRRRLKFRTPKLSLFSREPPHLLTTPLYIPCSKQRKTPRTKTMRAVSSSVSCFDEDVVRSHLFFLLFINFCYGRWRISAIRHSYRRRNILSQVWKEGTTSGRAKTDVLHVIWGRHNLRGWSGTSGSGYSGRGRSRRRGFFYPTEVKIQCFIEPQYDIFPLFNLDRDTRSDLFIFIIDSVTFLWNPNFLLFNLDQDTCKI